MPPPPSAVPPGFAAPARRALRWGCAYWGFYASLDYLFCDAAPFLLRPAQVVPDPDYWNAGLLAFCAVALAGSLAAAALGLTWRARSRDASSTLLEDRFAAAAALTVIAGFAILIASQSLSGVSMVLGAAAPAVFGAAALVAGLRGSIRRIWFALNPVTLSLALLTRPWLYQDLLDEWSASARIAASLGSLLLILGVSWLLARWLTRPVRSLRWTGVAAVAVALCGVSLNVVQRSRSNIVPAPARQSGSAKPNIILISLDTVRADHLHFNGYFRATSPRLDEFAAHATNYVNARSTADWTAPSHASLFTGMYALRHGVRHAPPNADLAGLPLTVPTLAETLAAQGYRSAALVANHGYLSDSLGFNRGFSSYRILVPVIIFEAYRYTSLIRSLRRALLPAVNEELVYANGATVASGAVSLLPSLSSGGPFFLFLNFMDAHWPYAPPEPFLSRFAASPAWATRRFYDLVNDVLGRKRAVTDVERFQLAAGYDASIAYLDYQLGLLFHALQRAGLYDRSLIIVTSDHGEAFGEKLLLEHGSSVYDDQVHVPLVIKYPGQSHPATVSSLASGVDVLPTLAQAAGAPLPRHLAGLPLPSIAATSTRPVFSESYPGADRWQAWERFRRVERAVFRGKWKFILSTNGRRELYDLSTDPGETRNLADSEPRTAAELQALVSAWQKNLAPVNARSGLDSDTVNRLRSLGYIQ
ncbi:MAG TPA: sulfatase [Paludibaculum sp.]|jgi:arylsulfatase A-like enzyme